MTLNKKILDTKDRVTGFVRDFTEGLEGRDVQRMFERDATRAIRTLSGSRDVSRGQHDLAWYLGAAKDFFVGLAMKLSPPRRLLFAASLLSPLLGLIDLDATFGPTAVFVDFAPFWFFVGLGGMTLLLALELADRLRVRDEIEVARELQRQLLPKEGPALAGWRVAHAYGTANAIGGDYYDFIPLPDGRLVLAVGDASGHGMGAGLLMAIGKTSLETALEIDPRPEAVLGVLNRVLCRTGGRRAFFTLCYAILDPRSGDLYLASAGHPFPLLRRAATGVVEELGRGSFPLGLKTDVRYTAERVRLEPGDVLVLYSDGIPEAVGASGTFGFDRLAGLVRRDGDPDVLHRNILRALDHHLGDHEPNDDFTLVIVGRDPHPPDLPPLPAEPLGAEGDGGGLG